MKLLHDLNQPRINWKIWGKRNIDGRESIELFFAETGGPRLISTADQAPAQGRFWVEEATGRVVRTELGIETSGVRATVTVTFGPADNVIPWVPLRMGEEYRPTGRRSAAGARSPRHVG